MTKKHRKITNCMPRPRLTIGGGDYGYMGFVELVQLYLKQFVCLKLVIVWSQGNFISR